MSFFVRTVPETEADGILKEFYQEDIDDSGYIANTTRAFSLIPEAWAAWASLLRAIHKKVRLRTYELATFAAAQEMGCTYCMLAHGDILRKNFFSVEELEIIARDFRHADLDEKDVAMMEFARKVVHQASSTTREDFDRLRGFGWTDEEIVGITLTAAARCLASKVFDALGADPDAVYKTLDEETHHALIGHRPISFD